MKGRSEIRSDVLDAAGDCPFCGAVPQPDDVQIAHAQSREYDEVYIGVYCPECRGRYYQDFGLWRKPTPPGEDAVTRDA